MPKMKTHRGAAKRFSRTVASSASSLSTTTSERAMPAFTPPVFEMMTASAAWPRPVSIF